MSGRVHEVSHLHKTRPNYLHIRAFHIYSEKTALARSLSIQVYHSHQFKHKKNFHTDPDYRPLGSQLYIRLIQRNLTAEQNATFLILSLYDEMYDDKIKLYY